MSAKFTCNCLDYQWSPIFVIEILSSSCPHWAFSIKVAFKEIKLSRTVTAILRPKAKSLRVCNSIPSLPQHTYTLFHNFRNLLLKNPVHHHIIKLNVSNLKKLPEVLKSLEHLRRNLHPMQTANTISTANYIQYQITNLRNSDSCD